MEIELSVIDFQSPLYEQVLALRNEILRRPLGLDLYEEDLSEEKNQYIIVALEHQKVLACLMIQIEDKDTVKLRQMAVDTKIQKKGLGSTLMQYAETFCSLNEYNNIVLHARKTAILFYEKLGYTIVGHEFLEVGIPHLKMQKVLL